MGPRTVKFPKKGPHFSRFEEKSNEKKREEKGKEKEKEKMEKSGKMKEERERPQITRSYGS